MELRHLRYFLAVAEELNFSRAAVRLHMAQPPLSQQIRDLEEEVGLQLFDRSSRRVSLTQVGKEFLLDAREVLASVAKLEHKALLRSQGNLGTLSISVITAMASSKFASMLRAFQKKNSEIKVSLSDHPSTWQVAALTGGTIDVGFLRPPSQIPPLIEIYRIKRDAMQIAVPLGHRLGQKKKIDWRDLADEGLILVEPELARNYYDGFFALCRKNGVEPRIQQYTGNVATQLWLISAGLGIAPMAITPELVKQNDVVFVGLPSDAPVYETVMAWRRQDSSPVIQRFVQFVKHYLAD